MAVEPQPAVSTTAPAPTATSPGPTTIQPTTVPPPTTPAFDDCTPEDFSLEVEMVRATFRPGEVVEGSATYTHTSDAPCLYNSTPAGALWLDALSGEEVATSGLVHGDCFSPCDPPSMPGDVKERNVCWTQINRFTGEPVPSGRYALKVLIDFRTATAEFEILDLPPTSTTAPAPLGC